MTAHTSLGRTAAVPALGLGLMAGGVATASAAPSSHDTTWMAAAHRSNLTEIAARTSAQAKATSQQVEDLGAMFVEMHTAFDKDLTAGAKALNVTLRRSLCATPRSRAALCGDGSGAGQ